MSDNEPAQILPEDETLRVNEWEAALTLVIGGTLIVVGLVGVFSGHGQYHHVPSWLGPVVGLLCIVGGIHIAAKCRSGLIVDQDGIVVQGAIRRRRWRWHEVERFELTAAIYVPVLRIDLADGGSVRVPGFKGRSRNERDLAGERVAELNRRASASRPK
jgi:hypothetical protein